MINNIYCDTLLCLIINNFFFKIFKLELKILKRVYYFLVVKLFKIYVFSV